MKNSQPLRYDKNLLIRVDQRFLDALDRLRSSYDPMPTRADMIRRLVVAADKKVK